MSAPILARARAACRQRGAAAVELAVVLSATMIVMLPALALCVLTFYQYSVMKTATDDAAAYLASLPRAAYMTGPKRQAARAQAAQMVNNAIAGAGITSNTWADTVYFACAGNGASVGCNSVVPVSIAVGIDVEMDIMGFDILGDILPPSAHYTHKITYTARSVAPYVN